MFSGCVRSPEAKEAGFLDAGKKELAKNDYTRAFIQFTNAIRVKKGDAEARRGKNWRRAGLILRGRGFDGSL
jgi:hypothetical protein